MTAYGALVTLHATGGAVGLISMIATLVRAKGTQAHRRVGRVFTGAMAVTSLTGFFVAAVLVGAPKFARPGASADVLDQMQHAGAFFAVLSLVTGQAVAVGVFASKYRDRAPGAHPLTRTINALLAAASVVALALGLPALDPFLLVGGSLGLTNAIRAARPTERPWLRTHIEAMLGACTAATTAFTVQISTRLTTDALVAGLAWTLPVLLGMFATAAWTRRLRTRKMVPHAG